MSDPYNFETMVSTPNPAPPVLSQDSGGVLSQQNSILSAGRDTAMMDAERAARRAEQSIDEREEFAARRAAALRPLRQEQMRAAAQPLPQPPQLKDPPKVPTQDDAQQQTWQQEWLTAAMFLGALAGGMTRRPLTNSLAAFTGMVEGFNEGSKQKFEQSMRTWEAENKRVLEANENANKAYDRILKSRQLDNEQKLIMLQIEAAQWDDQPMAQAAFTKDRISVAQLHDQRLRYGQELRQAQTRRDEERTQHEQMQATQWVNSADGQRRAQAIANYQLPAPSTLGRTGYQGALNTALMSKVLELNPDYDATKFEGKKSAARIESTTDPMTARRTEMAFATGPEARSVRSLNVAVDHLSVLEKLGDALRNGDINVINQFKNYAQKEFGRAAPTNWDAAKQIVGQEIIKAVVNNGGGVTERQEAARYLNDARSPEQIMGLISVYKRLMVGQLHGLEQQYTSGGGHNDFSKKLLPYTREEMARAAEGVPDIPNELRDHIDRLGTQIDAFATGAVTQGAKEAADVSEKLPTTGFRSTTEAIPGYNRGRGLPAGWNLTPMDAQ